MSNKIEKPVQHLVDGGYDAFVECNKEIVFQWLTKISYGILFKELSLKFDRSNPDNEPIYDPEDMKERKMQYTFLKSIINETTFHNKPYSIFVFRVKNNKTHYWAWENPFIHTFCMQMNDIGIVACLIDNNLNEQFFLQYEKQRNLLDQHLHPAQFLQVCAMIVYKASLLYRQPFYIRITTSKVIRSTLFPLICRAIYLNLGVRKNTEDCLMRYFEIITMFLMLVMPIKATIWSAPYCLMKTETL